MRKSNKNVKASINNIVAEVVANVDASINGEGGSAQKEKLKVVVDKDLKLALRQIEAVHHSRYIYKHLNNTIDAVNEASKSFIESENVDDNKLFFALAIASKCNICKSAKEKNYDADDVTLDDLSTARDVLCEFEKFVNAKDSTDEEEHALRIATRNALNVGVADMLKTTQKQTFNRLLAKREADAHAKADAEAKRIEAEAMNDINKLETDV